jgi:hypothetical protein
MGFMFNGTSSTELSITGGVGALIPNSEQTIVNISGTGNAGVQEAYTVPSGKTFYLFGYYAVLATGADITIFKTDGTTIVSRRAYATTAVEGAPHNNFTSPPWYWTTGEIVKVQASLNAVYVLWGIIT